MSELSGFTATVRRTPRIRVLAIFAFVALLRFAPATADDTPVPTQANGVLLDCVQCDSWGDFERCLEKPHLFSTVARCTLTNDTDQVVVYWGYPSDPLPQLQVLAHGRWHRAWRFGLCGNGMRSFRINPGDTIQFEEVLTFNGGISDLESGRLGTVGHRWKGPVRVSVELDYQGGRGSFVMISDLLLGSAYSR
jgi:hypothetical protein